MAIERPITRHQDADVHPSTFRFAISELKASLANQRYIPATAPAKAVPLPPLRISRPKPVSAINKNPLTRTARVAFCRFPKSWWFRKKK
jgi:hypothetical protein